MSINGVLGRPVLRAAIAAVLLMSLPRTDAAEIAYEASLGAGHSDNIRRVSANEEEENIATAGVRFSAIERGPRLNVEAVGDVQHNEYLEDTYESEIVGNFAGTARFAIVPDRFEWLLADNFGQVLFDPFAPPAPDNRENINYLTTGPDVTIGLGAQTRLGLGARYSLTTYEDSPLDSATRGAELRLERILSAATNVSLNANVQSVEYDNAALDADYDQMDAFLRYETEGARTHLSVDAGYTEIDSDASADSTDGLLLRLDVSRRLSSSTTGTLSAGREFANSGSAFATTQGSGAIDLQTVPGRQTAQPFVHDYARLDWTFARNRTSLSLYGSWAEQTYEDDATLDQSVLTYGTQITRDMSRTTSLVLFANSTRGDFEQAAGDYTDVNAGLVFNWRLSSTLSVRVSYDSYRRKDDGTAGDVNDNRYWLSVVFGRGEPRAEFGAPQFGVDEETVPQPQP